jgi:hypothetical protein
MPKNFYPTGIALPIPFKEGANCALTTPLGKIPSLLMDIGSGWLGLFERGVEARSGPLFQWTPEQGRAWSPTPITIGVGGATQPTERSPFYYNSGLCPERAQARPLGRAKRPREKSPRQAPLLYIFEKV